MTKQRRKSQKGGVSITKRGAVLEDIKKDRLDKFEQHLAALDSVSFDDHKAMWTAIEYSRPKHFTLLGQFQQSDSVGRTGGVHIEATRRRKKGTKLPIHNYKVPTDESVLQYALRVADYETIKAVITYPNANGFMIDHIGTYELLLGINHTDASKVLTLLFEYRDPGVPMKKYKFYDPYNRALEEAIKKNIALAKLILYNTHRDTVSLNYGASRLVDLIKMRSDSGYTDLFRDLVIGKLSRNPNDKQVPRPPLDVNRVYDNGRTIIFDLLKHSELLKVALVDGRADPNVRLGNIGDTPLHIVIREYIVNQGAAKPILRLLKDNGARLLINLKTRKDPLDLLTTTQQETFIADDKMNFK